HIVVFEGNQRLMGQTVSVIVEEATAFTLFGKVVTGEQVGVEENRESLETSTPSWAAGERPQRIGLPVV
ncbi:MAG: TRAM domain-containing protein, partial [Planctomycetes bacterium]|nr:TRAM domain-containing protein [Planctomycetota bacterium]